MKPLPVLLLPGIDDTSKRFARLQTLLEQNGFNPVLTTQFIPPDGSISMEAMAGQVSKAVQGLMQTSQMEQIDIVAYSMGTLAVRYYLQCLGGKQVVRRFISIAGPHHGTLTAYLRKNAGCGQMRPGSPFLMDLNADEDPWGKTEVFSYWTPFDLMSFPANTARLPWAYNRRFFVLAHPFTVSDRGVMAAVLQALKQ